MSKSDDLIRRADAIKTVIRMCSPICDWELEKKGYTDCVIDEINSLPSADAVQGEWIRVGYDIYECSLCHQNVMTKDIDCYSYCHRCGARMLGEDGEA